MNFFGGQKFGPMPIFECLDYSKQTLLPSRFEPNLVLLGGSRNRCFQTSKVVYRTAKPQEFLFI